jgi:hypothetical protein
MSARRIAVLVGSHDPTHFARCAQPDRPSEAAVLNELRNHRSTGEARHREPVTQIITRRGRSVARRAGAVTPRKHVSDPGGPPRIGVCAAAARTRSPVRHTRARILATSPAADARQ